MKTEFDPMDCSETFKNQFGAGRPLPAALEDYWMAPSGQGSKAFEWEDKPHRLVYDLISAVVFYSEKAKALEAETGVF